MFVKKIFPLVLLAAATVLISGCSKEAEKKADPVVRSMPVIVRDTSVVYDYTGFIEANREMEVVSQVSGQIKEKYFKGGENVQAGAWLYRIDQRNYYAAMLSAKSAFYSAEADAERYTKLYEKDAVSKQMLENTLAVRDAKRAMYISAQKDYDETIVKAPFDGRIDTTSLEVGNYAAAGQTVLTRISDTNPVYVRFSIAEPEYMNLARAGSAGGAGLENVVLTLANGEKYALTGEVTEVNRGISDGTGSMTCRAKFANPDKKLLPGMFAHIQARGETLRNAVLIPQRALVEMLYKKFVFLLEKDNKVSMKEIQVGQNVGRLMVVSAGLEPGDIVVVEGTGKLRNGMQVNSSPMQEADLDTTKRAQ